MRISFLFSPGFEITRIFLDADCSGYITHKLGMNIDEVGGASDAPVERKSLRHVAKMTESSHPLDSVIATV